MNPTEISALLDAFGILGLLMACVPLLVTIGLVVAIFQINSRIAELTRLQQQMNAQLQQSAELQRQAFIAQLASQGPNHQAYVEFLVDQNQLTEDQAAFILKQSGHL